MIYKPNSIIIEIIFVLIKKKIWMKRLKSRGIGVWDDDQDPRSHEKSTGHLPCGLKLRPRRLNLMNARRQGKDVPGVALLRGLRCWKRSYQRTKRGTEDWRQPIIAWLRT